MPASVKRLRRTPEEARRLILDTAQDLIARSGPEGLRLQEIAAAAGISHPLILHHFGSREGLVRALVQQAVDELRDKLIPAMGSAESSLVLEFDQVFDAFATVWRSGSLGSRRSIRPGRRSAPPRSCAT